jgi:hypothetical protein
VNNGFQGFPKATVGKPSTTTIVADGGGKKNLTLAGKPLPESLRIYKNGLLLSSATDYSISGAMVTLTVAPSLSDVITDYYLTSGPIGASRLWKNGSAAVPSDFGGILAWITAGSIVGLADNDPGPSTIQDLSSANNDATKVSTVTYKATAANGLPCLEFASAGRYDLPTDTFTGTTAAHAFILLDSDTDGSENAGFWWMGGNDQTYYTYTDGNIYDGAFTSTRYSYNPTPALTDWHVYEVSHNGTTRKAYLDGSELSSQTTGYTVPSFVYLGAGSGGTTWDGRIAAYVAYDNVLPGGDATAIREYLYDLAGI